MEQQKQRELNRLYTQGMYTKHEIAELLGCTAKDVEHALKYRQHETDLQKMRNRRKDIRQSTPKILHEPHHMVPVKATAKQVFNRMFWESKGFSKSESDLLTCKYQLSDGLQKIYTH